MSLRQDAAAVLEAQLELIKFYGSEEGKLYSERFMLDLYDKGRFAQRDPILRDEYAKNLGRSIAGDINQMLNKAPSYYVTQEMMDLTLRAGESVPDSPFTQADLPTPSGFVYLPTPLITTDIHGRKISARVFSWNTLKIRWTQPDNPALQPEPKQSMMYVLYSSKHDTAYDDYTAQIRRDDPELWMSFPPLAMVHWQPLSFDEPWSQDTTQGRGFMSTKMEPGHTADWIAFLKTFFLLVKQKITVVTRERPDRAAFRRLSRSALMPADSEMQIVMLRKHRPTSQEEVGDGTPVNWSHRWVVDGFWRNQWYPSEQVHKDVYIYSYIKGPEHLPLVLKDRVFVWKR